MGIGLNILSNLKICIGDNLSELMDSLDKNKLKYSLPYSSEDDITHNKNTIMYIESFGVELRTKDDEIVYIKTTSGDINEVVKDISLADNKLLYIKSSLANKLGILDNRIRIDRFEADTNRTILSIPYLNNTRIRVSMVAGIKGGIYIETMQIIQN